MKSTLSLLFLALAILASAPVHGQANDLCANATALTVNAVGACPGAGIAGDNFGAGSESVPACDVSTLGFEDVWYSFNSGTNTSVTIDIAPGTIEDLLVEVFQGGCAGTSIQCAFSAVTYTIAVTPATNYVIRVASNTDFGFGGTFSICLTGSSAAGPANDLCANATSIGVNAACVGTAGNLQGATQSLAPSLCSTFTASAANDVWYTFTAIGTSTTVQVTGGGDATTGLDPILEVYSGTCAAPVSMGCIDATVRAGIETMTVATTPGTVYRYRIYYWPYAAAQTVFTYTTCVFGTGGGSAPANDLCANATVIGVNATCVATAGNLQGATQSLAPSLCSSFTASAANDVWYTFTATSTSTTVQATGGGDATTGLDPVLEVFSGTCAALTSLGCVDATVRGGIETMTVTTVPGTVYRYRIYYWIYAAAQTVFNYTTCVVNGGVTGPANDNCASVVATSLAIPSAIAFTGDNTNALTTGDGVLDFGGDTTTVWHAFTTTACSNVTISFCNSVTLPASYWIALFSACPADLNYVLATNYEFTTCVNGAITMTYSNLPAGTYYLPVRGETNNAGPYTVNVATTVCGTAPANDPCASATPIAVNATCVSTAGNLQGATQSLAPSLCSTFTSTLANDVWYTFTATGTSTIVEATGGGDATTGVDPILEVFSGTCAALTSLGCVDATLRGGTETMTVTTTPGTVYLYRIYYWNYAAAQTVFNYTTCVHGVAAVLPPNDQCASVVPVALNVGGNVTFTGNNTNATTTNDYVPGSTWENPPPVPSSVWHAFTLSGCADITVSYCNTNPFFANVWILLATSCPANDNVIATTVFNNTDCGNGNWTVFFAGVPAGTYYFPVLGEAGSTGAYSVQLSAVACAGSGNCEGGFVLSGNNNTSEDVCLDGVPDLLSFITSSPSTEAYSYIVTDASNNVISLLAGNSFDFNAVAQGTYHIWGVSYNGILTNVVPGSSINGIGSNGTCFDLSTNFVTVSVSICAGVGGATGTAWNVFPNPNNGDFTISYGGISGEVTIDVMDLTGRVVHSVVRAASAGSNIQLALAGKLATGTYVLRVASSVGSTTQRIVVR